MPEQEEYPGTDDIEQEGHISEQKQCGLTDSALLIVTDLEAINSLSTLPFVSLPAQPATALHTILS
jgi:hypothetical protein